MSRIRTIKPEFQQSESMGRVSRDARLLFIQLWTQVDDLGRSRASSRMLASLLFPFDDDAPKLIDGWLLELEREGCILRYTVDGSAYLQVQNFSKHQKIDHASPSKLPPPPDKTEALANPRESSRALAPDLVPSTIVPSTKIIEATPLVEVPASTGEAVVVPISRKPDPARSASIRSFGEWWNDLAAELGFPQIDRIEGNREVAVLQRSRRLREDYGTLEDGLRFLAGKIRGSPFLQGKTGWRGFSFDWCMKAANFQKIVEGNYEREIQQARR